jgi:NADH:ubiquinone reductase (H+-translocating)
MLRLAGMEEAKTSRHFDVAILGGGFAGVYCARTVLKRLAHLGKTVCIVAEENHMVFQPMLPEVVGGSLSPRHVVNPIRLLCRGAEVLRGSVSSVDYESRSFNLDGGHFSPCVRVSCDHLVFAMGADVDLSRIPGMAEHSFLMRNVGDAMKLRAAIINRMEEANLIEDTDARRRLLSFVVVGGGHSGVETAGQMAGLLRGVCRYYEKVEADEPLVTVIHSRERLLPTLDETLGDYTKRQLEKAGIRVVLNQRVRAVTATTVLLESGEKIEATTVVCTVGNAPHPLIVQLGNQGALPLEKGKITVNSDGQIPNCPNMWAAGDCSVFPKADGGSCPETAQFAMRQGMHVGENITASMFEHPLEPFTFTGLGELAVIGHRSAVASIMGINFSGFPAWFMWRTIYLAKLPGLDRKLRVMVEWTLDLFFPRDINLLTPQYSSPLAEMHLEAGDPLFHPGEPAFSLYAVKWGRVDIVDAKGEIVKSAGPGDYFGERALLEDRVWRFDAIAREPSTLVAIDGRTFEMLVGSIESLDRMFTRSAQQYAMPEQIDRMVASLPGVVAHRTASDVMTRDVATLRASATVDEALTLFQSKHHSVYPVVDDQNRVVGALRRVALYDWLAHHGLDRSHRLSELQLGALLRIRPGTPVPQILEDLIRTGASKAAVVDDEQRLQGIVALYDLIGRADSPRSTPL